MGVFFVFVVFGFAIAVADIVDAGADSISVVTMFLGAGRHAREDLPRLVEQCRQSHPTTHIELQPPVGENPRLLDLIAQLALD